MLAGSASAQRAGQYGSDRDPISTYRSFRMGMSPAEARAAAPTASWRAGTARDEETEELRASASHTIGPLTFETRLGFEWDGLHRITYRYTETGEEGLCLRRHGETVLALESDLGWFRGGRPRSVVEGTAKLTVNGIGHSYRNIYRVGAREEGLAHQGRRHVEVSYVETAAASGARACVVEVNLHAPLILNPRVLPAPDPAALATANPITGFRWHAQPWDRQVAYPPEALRQNLAGIGELDCIVQPQGLLACAVASEEPPGHGFGEAARSLTGQMRVKRLNEQNISTIGRRIRVPIQFGEMSQQQLAERAENSAFVEPLIARARAARRPDEIEQVVADYTQRYGQTRETAFRQRIVQTIQPNLLLIAKPKLWMFADRFETRPEAEWRQSSLEARIAAGLPISQLRGTAPTGNEIGLSYMRAMANGSNVGNTGGRIEYPATIVLSGMRYMPDQFAASRLLVHHVRKRSCTPVGQRFRCVFQLWLDTQFSQAQRDAMARIPESMYGVTGMPFIASLSDRVIEAEDVFEFTPSGWRAPQIEQRMVNYSLRYQEGVVAGLQLTAKANQCIARQIANDPTVNNDPEC